MSIEELIKKVEALTVPYREIDADIYIAFNIPMERVGRLDRLGGCVGWWPKDAPYESAVDVPRYTTSLDAATELAERVLPGVELELTNLYNVARATLHHETGQFYGSSESNSLPVAICLAVLSAIPSGEQS